MNLILITIFLITNFVGGNIVKTDEYKMFNATAYCLSNQRMANGKFTKIGAVAGDTRILRLGTKIHIKNRGFFVVSDTGSKIKNLTLDIYMPSCKDAINFGRRKVLVRTL